MSRVFCEVRICHKKTKKIPSLKLRSNIQGDLESLVRMIKEKYLLVALKVNPDSPLKQRVVAQAVNCDVKSTSC